MGQLPPPTEPEQEAEKGRDPRGGTRARAEAHRAGQPCRSATGLPSGDGGTLAPTSHRKEGEGDRNQEASLPAVVAPRSVGAVLVKG